MESEGKLPGSVLYVEDDETTRAALGASLGRHVETLYLAASGRAGLELFARHAPDVVITDVAMPERNGLSMAREMKASRPETPVIVTTAFNDTQYLMEAIEIGIDGYVLKPVEFARLFALVERNLAFVDREREEARHRQEQRRLLEELQAAGREIKALSGLLPICANCKKIRSDEGYWTQIEWYLSEHADVTFSHGICPECMKAHYRAAPDEPGGRR